LTFSFTRQRLESVSWDCRDVFQFFSVIEHPEFPARHHLDLGELAAAAATEKLRERCVWTGKPPLRAREVPCAK
jgi:hypothetical protein